MIAALLWGAFAAPIDDRVGPEALPAWATPSGTVQLESDWWTTFADPGLVEVMQTALARNRDLAAAFARTAAADANATGALAPLLPTVSAAANATVAPTESLGFQFGGLPTAPGQAEPPKAYWSGQATLNASWDLDLFLRSQANASASRHDAAAAAGDRDAAVLAFATRVAEGYFDVITARERVRLTERQVADATALLEIVEMRYQAGDAASVDLLQQRQSAARTRAQLPLARATAKALEHQLAVALSLPPATQVPAVANELPDLPPLPDAGVPADLVLNRPDLRAAEERIASATDRRRNAVRSLFPTVRLTGTAGWQFFDLVEYSDQTFWNAGGSLSVPLFGGGRTQATIRAARATEHAQVHAYTQLAANAVLEVENALVNETHRALHREAVEEQTVAARAALDEAREQYVRGVGNYLALLTAQNTRDAAELALLDSHRQLLSARVQLHDALGGAWVDAMSARLGENR
jgi:NodT family efflux transporter outer membrane factor (OMF) lipoprotein